MEYADNRDYFFGWPGIFLFSRRLAGPKIFECNKSFLA